MTDEPAILITADIAAKVLEVVDAGLVSGLGDPIPGKMCVEAAVCFVLGLPHDDNPPCVDNTLREAKIALNDSSWSSVQTRAQGLRKLAVAQLGSAGILDGDEFERHMAAHAIAIIVPYILRYMIAVVNAVIDTKMQADDLYVDELREINAAILSAMIECETNPSFNLDPVCDMIDKLINITTGLSQFDPDSDVIAGAGYICDVITDSTSDTAANSVVKIINAIDSNSDSDELLIMTADIMVQILIDMKAPGCQWLSMCD